MGRVLIDDDHTRFGLGDDVVLVQLRAGGPEGQRVAAMSSAITCSTREEGASLR
jgi:protein subunit release factor B